MHLKLPLEYLQSEQLIFLVSVISLKIFQLLLQFYLILQLFHLVCRQHVAYIPNERVVGLSKIARVVEIFSKRLQTQERLTVQIANTLMEALDAKGVAVTIDSTHQCMTMRGIKKEQATTVTNFYLGQFKEDLSYQNRYLRFISTELKD